MAVRGAASGSCALHICVCMRVACVRERCCEPVRGVVCVCAGAFPPARGSCPAAGRLCDGMRLPLPTAVGQLQPAASLGTGQPGRPWWHGGGHGAPGRAMRSALHVPLQRSSDGNRTLPPPPPRCALSVEVLNDGNWDTLPQNLSTTWRPRTCARAGQRTREVEAVNTPLQKDSLRG
jgi:hypothetical protein